VYLNGSILGVSKKEMDECFDDITAFADIGEFIDQPVKMYSSGMYVRLAFAVAINVKPDILVVDEALSVGDTAFQAKCFAKFQEFQENGVTILFVTHSMDLVTRYCSNAILLDHGSVVKSGAAKDVVDEYNRRLVQCSKGQADGGADGKLPGSTSDDTLHNQTHTGELGYQLNPSENRYGNGRAEIIEVGIDSLSDKVKHSFVHGESYRFWFKTRFHSRLENPVTAFTIKDVKGFDLTGTNTMFKNVHIGTVEEGDIILTQFDQEMILNPGGYLLSFGCAGFENGEYVVYDRRYDVITFEVISDSESAGIFDMNSQISVSRVEE
jgi:teichoic acid transport system ATP-binding protein